MNLKQIRTRIQIQGSDDHKLKKNYIWKITPYSTPGANLFKESGHRPHDLRILEALGEDFLPTAIHRCGHGGGQAQEVDSQPAARVANGGGILLMEALEVGAKCRVHFARLNVDGCQYVYKTKYVRRSVSLQERP